MDDTDRQLIRLLRDNARLSVSSLAATLGVARGTVQSRLERLQADGTIQGFTLKLRPEHEAAPIRAIMMLEVRGGRLAPVVRALQGLPEVTSIHTTNGRWDLALQLAAENLARFDDVLRLVRLIDGVINSETSLLLSAQRG